MLVLSRKESETICLGDNIKITVVRVNKDRVRIGIDAPSDVHVLRGELANREYEIPMTSFESAPLTCREAG